MSVNQPKLLLPLPQGCIVATFIRRVKRFSIELDLNGQRIWAHTNNSGAMLGLLRKGAPAILSPAPGKNRKLPWTLERIWIGNQQNGFWAGVNTSIPNLLLKAAFQEKLLEFADGYESLQIEKKTGNSRLDGCFECRDKPPLWVECKNVTLVEDGIAAFPDAVSERALKHLKELIGIVKNGWRGAMFFVVQRPDGECFAPADYIDTEYSRYFYEALNQGVEVYVYEAKILSGGIALGKNLKIKGPV